MKRRGLDRIALAALRRATELLGLAIGTRLVEMREQGSPVQALMSRTEQDALHLRLLQETIDILAARWDKIPDRHRPHYTPEQRFRILRLRDLLALSREELARTFRISASTFDRWAAETAAHSDVTTVGSLVRPVPPVRRYADIVRHLVSSMALCGFGGNDLIARTLARAGWKISARTVARVRKEKPPPSAPQETIAYRGVVANYPNHIWMADLTEIPALFRLFSFKLAVVFDAFSRMPLAAGIFRSEPSAEAILQLIGTAASIHGSPRHYISDQGSQFTSALFRRTLERLGVRQRFGAIGKTGSIALIERLWRTLKDTLALRSLKPLVVADCRRRVELGLFHYAWLRPHEALGGATPAEIFFASTPAHLAAVHPPRGLPGQGPRASPFEIRCLDPERRLPFLVAKAA
jgi:putative transposase